MGGAFISPGMSRIMAKWMMGVQVIDPNTTDSHAQALVQTVSRLARSANIPMPQVGVYESPDINAFATGPTKSRSLVAVSSGLLQRMNDAETEGVLGHEISHIANGDMVTMTLLQGVVNAFAMFLSRVIAWALVQGRRSDDDRGGSYMMVYMVQMVIEMVLLMLGSLVVFAFSRYREFHADAGSARIGGREMPLVDVEQLGEIARARRVAAFLGRAELLQMQIADAGLVEARGKLALGKSRPARGRNRARVDHETDARASQLADHGI